MDLWHSIGHLVDLHLLPSDHLGQLRAEMIGVWDSAPAQFADGSDAISSRLVVQRNLGTRTLHRTLTTQFLRNGLQG